MRTGLFAGAIWLALPLVAQAGEFVGQLQLAPEGCEKTRDCRIVSDFGYVDSLGVGWQTKAGDKTDGATIPSWAQGIIGLPFDATFVKAAVIHDHYCDRKVRPWRQTHRVLYDALISSGVPRVKANVMYYAVLVGGPKWIDLIPGNPCPVGKMCIQSVPPTLHGGDLSIGERDGGVRIAFRNAAYDTPSFRTDLSEGKALIESSMQQDPPERIEQLASGRHPDDVFFALGDTFPAR